MCGTGRPPVIPVLHRLVHHQTTGFTGSPPTSSTPQAKNGEALPPGPLARPQRVAAALLTQHTAKEAADGGEREEAEQKGLLTVQCSLLKILSKALAALQRFTPDCCQILLDQVRPASYWTTGLDTGHTAATYCTTGLDTGHTAATYCTSGLDCCQILHHQDRHVHLLPHTAPTV